MITPEFVRVMAAYNAEVNRRTYAAAAALPDETRRRDEGAFWGSIQGTLSHLVWADHMWMWRLADWPNPGVKLADSATYIDDFAALSAARVDTDARLRHWAEQVDADWLAGTLVWFSGATQREQTRPRGLVMAHLFNHQTHHRGQAHALLTRHGQDPGATDLPFVLG